ncbi:MAG: DNA repair protein RecN [Clostridia bacterium]|nr:DNA repair protein RecN [Clostridia bacterium]
MLTRLAVHNLALIENMELSPCGQLNILSGETGAGKSIIVDGLMLLLGARYDKSLLRYGTESGYVEGVFDATVRARDVMNELGLDEDDQIIVTRRFFADGKNEIRINGRAATMSMLRALTATLVDIYGQNEYQSLIRTGEHLRILDYYIRNDCKAEKKEYADAYARYRETVAALGKIGDGAERIREIDLLRFQIDEINDAKTYESEEDELNERRNLITSAERIYAALGQSLQVLNEQDEGAASELVSQAQREIGSISSIKSTYAELYERLHAVSIELSDVCEVLRDESEGLHFDMNELDELEKRLDFIRSLKRKYGNFSAMNVFREKAQARLEFLENADEHYEALTREKKELTDRLYVLAQSVHDKRTRGAEEFARKIKKELNELGMENSDFRVVVSEFPARSEFEGKFGQNGADTAEFYLSPNAGQPLKPLVKIISGGEMSRFMLALKVISNQSDDIPTMIFDEIDAGISGITGRVVAKKLAMLSREHQVLCVTHLPQIASMADAHFFIYKRSEENNTVTNVVPLDGKGMIDEISRLSGSKGISEQSDTNAQTMKRWSDEYKASLAK